MNRYFQEVRIDQISEPENPLRHEITFDEILELAESIKARGLLQPILLNKKGDSYEVEAGHRRLLAIKTLGWAVVPSYIQDDIDEENMCLDRAHENLVREDLNPVDEAKLIYKMVYEDGRGVEKTAELLSKKPGWVQARMDIMRWPEPIINAIQNKRITITIGKELCRVQDEERLSILLDSAIEYGATARVVRQWVEDYQQEKSFDRREVLSESGEIQTIDMGRVFMDCRICGIKHEMNKMRHIWLCPDCLIVVRGFASETRKIIEETTPEEET